MYHSMFIGNKNTWDDYGLVPQNKIYFPTASQKTKVIDIEGASGSLDLSTYLTGFPLYSQRTGEIPFFLLDSSDHYMFGNGYPWPTNYTFYDIFDRLRLDLDGRVHKMWLEDDPDWYVEGRINVTTDSSTSPRPTVTLSYDIGPYKMLRRPLTWELHGLGSIINRQIISADEAGSMPQSIRFIVTNGPATVGFKNDILHIDETKQFSDGDYTVYEWPVYGETAITLSAATTCTLKIYFVPGRL